VKDLIKDLQEVFAPLDAFAGGDIARAAAAILAYIVIANLILRPRYSPRAKAALFGVANLAAVYLFFFSGPVQWPFPYDREKMLRFAAYVAFATAHWPILVLLAKKTESAARYLTALAWPILPLLVVKIETAWMLIGFSYMAFRMAQAAFELRRTPDIAPTFSEYVAFLFFPLTIPIGPISPFGVFRRALVQPIDLSLVTIGRGIARIVLGYVMLRLLATIAFQMSFGGMWRDGFRHGIGDFLIAGYSSLAYLYFNFAGFTHIVIGAAALVGVPVKENFNSPILSRSIKEFWNRWHITLSEFVRDLVYTPLAVQLTRSFGPSRATLAAATAAIPTFLAIGLWHQISVGFLIFGLLHGLGFAANLVFDRVSRAARKGALKPLFGSPLWPCLCWLATMTYIGLTMFFIENPTLAAIREALAVLEPAW
jgi:membrane protein involved in D-alanine export